MLAGSDFLADPAPIVHPLVEGPAFEYMRLLFHGLFRSLPSLSEAEGETFSREVILKALKTLWFTKKPNGFFGVAVREG
jgi:hypothetical protein